MTVDKYSRFLRFCSEPISKPQREALLACFHEMPVVLEFGAITDEGSEQEARRIMIALKKVGGSLWIEYDPGIPSEFYLLSLGTLDLIYEFKDGQYLPLDHEESISRYCENDSSWDDSIFRHGVKSEENQAEGPGD